MQITIPSQLNTINNTQNYPKEISRQGEVPKIVILNTDAKFTSNFWKGLFIGLGTQLNSITSYHPQTDGYTKITNQILEDIVFMYAMDQLTKWEYYLHLVKFSLKNSYQAFVKISSFEVLYRWKFHTLLSQRQPEDGHILGPDILRKMEQVVKMVRHY